MTIDSDVTRKLQARLSQLLEETQALEQLVHGASGVVADRQREKWAKMKDHLADSIRAHEGGDPAPEAPRFDDDSDDSVVLRLKDEEVQTMLDIFDKIAQLSSRFDPLLRNMALIYLMALWEAFVSDLMHIMFCHRPEMMKSGANITYEELLKHASMDDLVTFLASREVRKDSYATTGDRLAFLAGRLRVDFDSMADLSIDDLVEMDARRNLLVHNGGIVNRDYMKLVPDTSYAIGDEIGVDEKYWQRSYDIASRSAIGIVRCVLEAFFEPGEVVVA